MKSLGVRIALIISGILFGLMLVAGIWLERQLTKIIHQEEIEQAEVHARTLLASLQTLMLNGQGTLAREWLDRMRGAGGIVDVQVFRQDGSEAFTDLSTVHQVNDFLEAERFSRAPADQQNAHRPGLDALRTAMAGRTAIDESIPDQLSVLMPIESGTECLACHGYDPSPLRGVLKLSLSVDDRERRVEQMRAYLWGISGVLAAMLGVAILLALRYSVLRPIGLLRNAIKRVGEGDRDAKLPVDWRDELGEVAEVFNRTQKALRATETRIRSVTDTINEGIITIDAQGTIESANPAALTTFGYSTAELIGRNVNVIMPEPYHSLHDSYLKRYMETGRGSIIGRRGGIEVSGLRKDGTVFPLEISVSEMKLEEGSYFIGIVRDITERKEQSAALEHQALHDALTDLPNRTLLADRLRQAVLRGQRTGDKFALLLMDLDHFKEINDTLGHHFVDMVLQQVAQRMRSALRESDTIARLGGDEFAVLLPTSDVEQAKVIAEKLLRNLDKPFSVDDQLLPVGGSIGIAIFPDHGEDENTLMRLADVAMYVAKRGNRGFSVYDPSNDDHNPRTLSLLGELRTAIDMDELVVYYQPKVDLRTQEVCGVEALVRWRHPEHGLMLPDEFIPLAEHSGLIRPLTLWVMKEALWQAARWHNVGISLGMAINLSVRNLHDLSFPQRVARIVESMGNAPQGVWLEITETAIMADPARAQDILNTLSSMDVKLSIDDFGTGYSSLSYLKRLPVQEVKIDKSFVMHMFENENDEVIVRSIVDLAHNIGMKVIAEGVESEAAFQRLREWGCDYAQGFYISPPVPQDVLEDWLRTSPWPVAGRDRN